MYVYILSLSVSYLCLYKPSPPAFGVPNVEWAFKNFSKASEEIKYCPLIFMASSWPSVIHRRIVSYERRLLEAISFNV